MSRRKVNKPVASQMAAGLKALGDAVYDGGLRQARGAAARVARNAARNTQMVKSRTGKLIAGVKVSNTRKGGTKLLGTAPHTFLVERGHGGPQPAPPHPFMTTAVQSTVQEQLDAAAKAMRTALRKARKARPAGPR